MRQQSMYSFRHVVLDLYIVSVCEHVQHVKYTFSKHVQHVKY